MRFFTLRKTLLLLLLLALVYASWWLQQANLQQEQQQEVKLRHEPDYFMKDFTLTVMSETGEPQQILRSNYMAHYPDDDSTELLQPRVVMYGNRQEQWLVEAETGRLTTGGETLAMKGNVAMRRDPREGQPALVMYTRDLVFDTVREYARTVQPVTLERGPYETVTALGLEYFMKEDRLVLNDQVRFVHDQTMH